MNQAEPVVARVVEKADSEFRSLVSLLDDPDSRVAEAVVERLRLRGASILEPLLDFIDISPDELARRRALAIAKDFTDSVLIQGFSDLRVKLQQKKRGTLEEGAFLIARFGSPRLDVEYYKAELDALAGMLLDRIKGIH